MIDSGTIAAIATPPGEGGIGVIRISGSDAPEIAGKLFRLANGRAPKLTPQRSHRLMHGTIVDPSSGAVIDDVLRAFLNGRLDLTQAEAVLQVITARTGEGLKIAVDDLGGSLAGRIAPARA